jgi:hypothetical protein
VALEIATAVNERKEVIPVSLVPITDVKRSELWSHLSRFLILDCSALSPIRPIGRCFGISRRRISIARDGESMKVHHSLDCWMFLQASPILALDWHTSETVSACEDGWLA